MIMFMYKYFCLDIISSKGSQGKTFIVTGYLLLIIVLRNKYSVYMFKQCYTDLVFYLRLCLLLCHIIIKT